MTPRDAAVESIRRMKAAWPAWSWAAEMEREYGRALMDVGDPELIELGTTRAIREVSGRFPPPLADLLQLIERCRIERKVAEAGGAREYQASITVDEGALRDAIAALDYARDADERALIEDQIASIRGRLPDRGARAEEMMARETRFLAAAPDPYDPPGTLRFVVVYPDGTRFPKGARLAGEV